jgi:hypothetical protein
LLGPDDPGFYGNSADPELVRGIPPTLDSMGRPLDDGAAAQEGTP